MSGTQFDHIAIAVPRMADAPAFLAGELGGTPYFGFSSGAFRFGQWRFAGGGRLEVLEPRGEASFLHRFLQQHGPGIHHVTFKVPSLREACDRATARGYAIVGYNDRDPHWMEAFLHPRQALGIVVQLAQTDVTPKEGGGAGFAALPHPESTPPPVTMIGLRLRARTAERARLQWVEVLEGQGTEGEAGELLFRWPGSPMRLAVEVEPAGEEGPLRIELASERPLALPAGPHPVLGAVFALRPRLQGSERA